MELIITTKEELASVIQDAIKELLANYNVGNSPPKQKWLNIADALKHINNRGIKISKGTLYSMTHKKEIPFLKSGIHVVFDQEELDEWIKNRVARKSTQQDPVAASARRKALCPHKS
ncbi:helix-turn-helix domain-containing protein [Dyadobacter sp. 3J3]|uniref:helix-turn-helix domain-containing protein n=1 Tax=Dyadobacter sp. 3J3 TaxID=2606600 RepID=UPI0013579C15|nr:helix-turn-helix domain-containing protein [Dyadobacter sp. 3J3]